MHYQMNLLLAQDFVDTDFGDDKSLLMDQINLIQIVGCMIGVSVQTVGEPNYSNTVLEVGTGVDAILLMDALSKFDDTVPCPDAWFHIWELSDKMDQQLERRVVLAVKTDISWDSVERAAANPR